jgi:hypothetical protein
MGIEWPTGNRGQQVSSIRVGFAGPVRQDMWLLTSAYPWDLPGD